MVDFSIAIPTLNRAEVLKASLTSILKQTILPKEVIIIDDSKNSETKNLAKQMMADFSKKNIKLTYTLGKGHGLAEARNIGVTYSTGEIHISLDDDVVLDQNYAKEILSVYAAYPNALGVGGYVVNRLSFTTRSNALNRLFQLFFYEKDKCRVFASGVSYPSPLTRVINSEWLSGTNSSYRRKILNQFKWDENLMRYSLCEDLDISYRIQQSHHNSLYITPKAKVFHKRSALARIGSEYRRHMEISYHTYVFFKNIKKPWNLMNFVWGICLGRLIHSLLTKNAKYTIFTIKAECNMLRHLQEIKAGIFTSFEAKTAS